jgi:PAS domain S-box-containing protein
MIDLLETQRIKTAIEANPANYAAIIEGTPLAICLTGPDRTFTAVNNNYCALYGYTQQELVGKPFAIVVPDENKELMEMLHDKFLVDKKEIARNWEVQDKLGRRIQISVDAGYTDKLAGKPHNITLIARL